MEATLYAFQVGYDPHSAMRGALGAGLAGIPGGKP